YDGLNTALLLVLIFAVARGSRAAAGRNVLAVAIMGLVLIGLIARQFITGVNLPFELSMCALIVFIIAVAMLRFGLLTLAGMFFVNNVANSAPYPLNSADWFAPMSYAAILLMLGLAVYGFVISRGGEPLLGRVLADA